ncbi:hypothetical protein AALO_G00000690 [Alosa alosa]|uniref:Uncharacterized protein n=1 Tax=Alosa alosa TaxID=278164 RepID=A0AAV6HH14_9TELE|nr:hypothetical protein AALO_G00000690 [Alosa alosa]
MSSAHPRPLHPHVLTSQESEEQGQIQIAHVEENVLKRTGGTLMTVESSSPQQRPASGREPASQPPPDQSTQNASNTSTSEEEEEEEEDEESGENGEREEKEEKEEEDKLSPFYSCDSDSSSEEKEGTSALRTDPGDTEESSAAASEPKAVVGVSQVGTADSVSKPVATVRTQSLPRELGLTSSGQSDPPAGLKTHTHLAHTHLAHTQCGSSLAEESQDSGVTLETTSVTLGSWGQEGSSEVASGTCPLVPSKACPLPGSRGLETEALPREEAPSSGSPPPEPPPPDPGATRGPSHPHTPTHTHTQREASHTHTSSADTHRGPQECAKRPPTDQAVAAGEAWGSGSGVPKAGVLHACRERVERLEECLQQVQGSLTPSTTTTSSSSSMQDSVEKQLLSCQEMFQEIELKVCGLSSLDVQDAVGETQQEAEALSSKLELLKNSLVTFQNILQASPQRELPLEARRRRSSSLQEMFSSSKSQLIRQSSLQQQRELGLGLSEQRDLTKALARQGSRTRLQSLLTSEEQAHSPAGPSADAAGQEEEVASHRKWTHLLSRLTDAQRGPTADLTSDPEHSEVCIPAVSVWSSLAGDQSLQDITEHLTHLTHLREVTLTAAQASPDELSQRRVDEGLFELLCSLELSLSSLSALLHTHTQPCSQEHTHTQQQLQQVQSISAVLSSVDSELASLGPAVCGVLSGSCSGSTPEAAGSCSGSAGPSECLVLVQQHVAEVQTMMTTSQTQLQERLDTHTQLQVVAELQPQYQEQERLLTNLQKEAESQQLPSSLSQQAVQLEAVLESVCSSLQRSSTGVCDTLEKQRLLRRLVQGLRNLLLLARDRITHTYPLDTHTPAQLQHHISTQEGPETIHPHRILQIWTQWELSRSWLENRLTQLEKQLPIMHLDEEEETEEELQENTSVYEKLRAELRQCHAHSHMITEHVQRLHREGGASDTVGGATQQLELRLAALQQKVDHGLNVAITTRSILSR